MAIWNSWLTFRPPDEVFLPKFKGGNQREKLKAAAAAVPGPSISKNNATPNSGAPNLCRMATPPTASSINLIRSPLWRRVIGERCQSLGPGLTCVGAANAGLLTIWLVSMRATMVNQPKQQARRLRRSDPWRNVSRA
jgi:hypothetical protein